MKPVTPSVITSGTEPRRNAITGVPHAMASIMTRPKGSGQSIGNNNAGDAGQQGHLVLFAKFTQELYSGQIKQRSDDSFMYSRSARSTFAAILIGDFGTACNVNCQVGTLLR